MEFWTFIGVLRRRWYIVVPGLVLTIAVGFLVIGQVKPSYQAEGKMLLLQEASRSTAQPAPASPSTTLDPSEINPTGQLGLQKFAVVVADAAADSKFLDDFVASGGTPNYSVKPPFADVPTLTLTTAAATPEQAMSSYRHLVDAVNQVIVQQQEIAGELGPLQFKAYESIVPSGATPQGGARTKALIMVVAVGLMLTAGVAVAFDSLVNARKQVRPKGQVTLISQARSPLDELAELDEIADPEPPPDATGSEGGPMRW